MSKIPEHKRLYLKRVGLTDAQIARIEQDLEDAEQSDKALTVKGQERGPFNVVSHLTEQRRGIDLVALVLNGEQPTPKERRLTDAIAEAVWLNLAGLPHLAKQLLKSAK